MMAKQRTLPHLIDRLPPTRGGLTANAPLAKMTWFRVGGPAEVLFRPADRKDLADFLNELPADVPLTVLGLGANLLIRDGGVPGVVVRLGPGFDEIRVEGNDLVVGAAAVGLHVAVAARDAGFAGLEFLSGIPGTIGGALRMNAGAFGAEIKDMATEAQAIDRNGIRHGIDANGLGFSYRHSGVPNSWIFVAARLRGRHGDKAAIGRRMAEIQSTRQDTQPVRTATGGSTFVNPPNAKAWELIDQAGCRGIKRGGAQVSDKHCNFLVNLGSATAADLEGLGDEVRRRVLEASGIALEWEIRRIGVPAAGGPQ
ncbi:MAG: UDP-N-acetylmuramate dehydrogenase [Rhodospirillales bacterium]|nr:UDP-N-acetylmuramate dehydrogenase [Rhodospirillales bacterium]